jgi:hypothetical protein
VVRRQLDQHIHIALRPVFAPGSRPEDADVRDVRQGEDMVTPLMSPGNGPSPGARSLQSGPPPIPARERPISHVTDVTTVRCDGLPPAIDTSRQICWEIIPIREDLT